MDTTESLTNVSAQVRARAAGLLYFAVIGLGVCTLQLRGGLLVRGDGVTTAANIASHQLSFRLSLLAEVAAGLAYLGVVVLLYRLMAPVNRQLSQLAAAFGVGGCVIGSIAVIPLALPLIDATRATDAHLTILAVGLYSYAYKTALIFFGCYCLSLGLLTMRASFMPTLIGALLVVSGLSWLSTGVATFLSPAMARAIGTIALAGGGLGETIFAARLVFWGVEATRYPERTAQAAL